MKVVHIIVHCWAKEIPEFAKLLSAQLSSLVVWRPRASTVKVSVCTSPEDGATLDVIETFAGKYSLQVEPVLLAKAELFRRAIGRNMVAKHSQADVVWFADCDYVLGPNTIDDLASSEFPGPLVFPQYVLIHKSHQAGDEDIAAMTPSKLYTPDPTRFQTHRVRYAIGGLQIVPGDVARRGYLDGSRWVRPVSEDGGFRNTTEDKAYRSSMGGSYPISLPNVLRFRHSRSAFESAEKRLAQTAGKE